MARKFYAFPAGSGIEIDLDPTLVTPGAKISEDGIRALVPPGTYILGSADDSIEIVKAGSPLAMLTAPSLTGSMKIGGEATISPGMFTAGASVSHVLVWQDGGGNDVEFAAGAASFLWTSEYDTRPVRVLTTATLGGETLVVASPSQAVTYNAPTTQGALLDMVHTEDTGNRTVDASGDFAVVGDPALAGITWSVTGTGATISSAGVVTITTADARQDSVVTVTATNSGGSASSAFAVTVGTAVVPDDLAIRFGALTPIGAGGAQARNGSGAAVDITAITSQPSTRWTLSEGKLVATGSPAMVSEQITATVGGSSTTISIVVVPGMVSVASLAEFDAINMTPAGTGDFTIELRAGVNIPAAAANSKIAGTAGSSRVLGGTLTLTGEDESGAPAANIDGRFKPRYFSGGRFVLKAIKVSPTTAAGQAAADSNVAALLQIDQSPTTDVVIDGVVSVGNPAAATGWPGKTANNGGNDWGHDPWGALIRVNNVTGSFRPYQDGQVGSGPDIITCGTSGVKRVLMGMHALGGGVYEMQFSDNKGNDHSVDNALVSGEGAGKNIVAGETVTGLDGGSATVMAAPSGVDTAGGRYSSGGVSYTYQIRGPRWMDTPTGGLNTGTANTVRSLTIRNCNVIGCDSVLHPYAIESVVIEQNVFGLFTQDLLKISNPTGNPNFRLIVRRNDFYGSLQNSTDLGSVHCDYIQIFGQPSTAVWPGLRMHHNRILCNKRGSGQGIFNTGDGANPVVDGQFFGNILVVERGGNGISWNLQTNSQVCHNTLLVNRKEEGLPTNWSSQNGSGMAVAFSAYAPGTDVYSGWNAARRFSSGSIMTEKNFGYNGNTSMAQDALFVGLGGARPFYFQTFEEVMIGAKVTLTGADDKVGALGSNSDWSGYPYRVTTGDAHLPFKLDYDPGDLG